MSRTTYLVILWIVIVGGLLPAFYFLSTWHPRRRFSTTSLDAGGWVVVIAALYLLAAFRAALGHYTVPSSTAQAWFSFGIGAAIDLVIWLRALRWRRFRRDPPQRRSTDCE